MSCEWCRDTGWTWYHRSILFGAIKPRLDYCVCFERGCLARERDKRRDRVIADLMEQLGFSRSAFQKVKAFIRWSRKHWAKRRLRWASRKED